MRKLGAVLAAAALAGCVASSSSGEERFPTSEDFPPGAMQRIDLIAGGGHDWTLSALRADRVGAEWRIVIVTGTPSWSEYWAPTLASAPEGLALIVADRPGFAQSEPQNAVTDIRAQAEALATLIESTPPEQRVVLIGQSYGAAVAATLAEMRADRVEALVLMSPFMGDRGPTARRLLGLGAVAEPLLPRDLRNALAEIRNQPAQLAEAKAVMDRLEIPIVVLHGDDDDFAPLAAAESLAEEIGAELMVVPAGDHFLNACCVDAVLAAASRAIDRAEARRAPD